MSLAGPCHAVSEASGVVALAELGEKRLHRFVEHLSSGLLIIKDLMEGKGTISYA